MRGVGAQEALKAEQEKEARIELFYKQYATPTPPSHHHPMHPMPSRILAALERTGRRPGVTEP